MSVAKNRLILKSELDAKPAINQPVARFDNSAVNGLRFVLNFRPPPNFEIVEHTRDNGIGGKPAQ